MGCLQGVEHLPLVKFGVASSTLAVPPVVEVAWTAAVAARKACSVLGRFGGCFRWPEVC